MRQSFFIDRQHIFAVKSIGDENKLLYLSKVRIYVLYIIRNKNFNTII